MVGSIAPNLHEGSRSEYLAQYVFSSFGTAIPVPHPEDSGIDIYCTILEREGQRAWPRAYFSVQVKSTMDPWVFSGPESVRWLIEHPLPIFLCVVLKSEARILVYNTTPRFAAWTLPIHQEQLTLIPGTETKAQPVEGGWVEGESFQLRAPILNFTIQEILDDTFRNKVVEVLKFWIGYDVENLFRIKCGIHHFQVPYEYETNSTKVTGLIEQGGPFDDESFLLAQKRLEELLRVIASHHCRRSELLSAALYAMTLRHLSPHFKMGEFTPHDSHLHGKINSAFGLNRYAYEAIDSLLQKSKGELLEHGITDAPVC
ncbi:MAG: hypothetical protein WAV38_32260 [Xanthobacteraceae bacterium]